MNMLFQLFLLNSLDFEYCVVRGLRIVADTAV